MAFGAGVTDVDGRDVYGMRYVDWFFTTPFFLLDLALLAGADTWDTFYVMLMNAICIAAGAIGALVPACKMPMFALGMITFVMFNAKLFGAMSSKAKELGDAVASKCGFSFLLLGSHDVLAAASKKKEALLGA